jgi:methyl-accepting chemotaxis protein
MKNMKLGVKLIGAFMVIAFITLVVGVIGVTQINKIQRADARLYEENVQGLAGIAELNEAFLAMRIKVVYALVNKFGREQDISNSINDVKQTSQKISSLVENFDRSIADLMQGRCSINSRQTGRLMSRLWMQLFRLP